MPRGEIATKSCANRAKLVFATCGNDLNNIEIGSHSSTSLVLDQQLESSDQNHHRTWWLHVVDPTSLHALKAPCFIYVSKIHRARSSTDRFASGIREPRIISKSQLRGLQHLRHLRRRMLLDYPLDRRYIDEKDRTVVWLVIIGFGRMGKASDFGPRDWDTSLI